MNKPLVALVLAVGLLLVGMAGLALAGSHDNGVMAKHLHAMGGPQHDCLDCHNADGPADPPPPLKGRYANMGGPNHECVDCHVPDGTGKAPPLPLPPGYEACGDCHPSS